MYLKDYSLVWAWESTSFLSKANYNYSRNEVTQYIIFSNFNDSNNNKITKGRTIRNMSIVESPLSVQQLLRGNPVVLYPPWV